MKSMYVLGNDDYDLCENYLVILPVSTLYSHLFQLLEGCSLLSRSRFLPLSILPMRICIQMTLIINSSYFR